ncbi:hypothetical protein [Halomicronema sp. CCY15110]|nr:hypothetical protein [Halomicronema sp. CCY15110]
MRYEITILTLKVVLAGSDRGQRLTSSRPPVSDRQAQDGLPLT